MKTYINNFNGGLTDFIHDADISKAATYNNLQITNNGKPISRNGSRLYSSTVPLISSTNQRLDKMFLFSNQLFIQSMQSIYYIKSNALNSLLGPAGFNPFNGTESNYISVAEWNGHLIAVTDDFTKPIKIYDEGAGTFRLRTAGLPKMVSNPTITPDANDSKNYIYNFVYTYEYIANELTFLDVSTTTAVERLDAADFSGVGHYNVITNIPVLSGNNYDTANIKVKIYRTIHNGSTFYYVGEITNGTTTFTDTVTDANLILNTLLYTEGGVLDNDEPPPAKFVSSANDVVCYGYIKEGTQTIRNRIRQSHLGDPDSCPESFYVDIDNEITGMGSLNTYHIVFTKDKVFRIEGYFDYQGRGGMTAIPIYDKSGCIGNNSIVKGKDKLYFAGKNGWYATDGFNCKRLNENQQGKFNLEKTYATLISSNTKKLRMTGAYDEVEGRVYWAIQEGIDCDKIFVYHEAFDSFTTMNGGNSFCPTAIIFENGDLIRGDRRGYLFKHDAYSISDPIVNTATTPSSWNTQPIIYTWKHVPFNFGSPDVVKYVTKLTVNNINESDLDLQINNYNDSRPDGSSLIGINYNSDFIWGDPTFIWGISTLIWGKADTISKTRYFPKGSLRCKSKQIELTNAYSYIAYSDSLTTATTSMAADTLTLTSALYSWPEECVGYDIRFLKVDGTYTSFMAITARISDTIIGVAAVPETIVGTKWEIKGYPKNQKFHLDNIAITYEEFADKGGYYKTGDNGGNN